MRRRLHLTIAFGIFVAAAVAVCVSLGMWQFRRLDERRSFNATLTARTNLPVTDLTTLMPDPSSGSEDALYRRVHVTGVFDPDQEVLVVGRSHGLLAGHHVVTPMQVGDAMLVVNRGWVPLDLSTPPVAQALPPPGPVTVTGVLFPSQERGRFGPVPATDGPVSQLHRVDVPRLQQQIDEPVYPFYLLLESQSPSQSGEFPILATIPTLDEGPHLSYGVQWFAFAGVALATYIAFILKGRRNPEEDLTQAASLPG